MNDRPQMNADRAFLDAKRARVHEPHVRPVNELAERWIREGRKVPFVDPDMAGVRTRILFLFESPGPKASSAHGSGLISTDNADPSAARFWRLTRQAGLAPGSYLSWNVVPWYVSGTNKNQNATAEDAKTAQPYLHEFVTLLPDLRVVVLMGVFARDWWFDYARQPYSRLLPALAAPHPSPRAHTRNRPVSEGKIVDAIVRAKQFAGGGQP